MYLACRSEIEWQINRSDSRQKSLMSWREGQNNFEKKKSWTKKIMDWIKWQWYLGGRKIQKWRKTRRKRRREFGKTMKARVVIHTSRIFYSLLDNKEAPRQSKDTGTSRLFDKRPRQLWCALIYSEVSILINASAEEIHFVQSRTLIGLSRNVPLPPGFTTSWEARMISLD